MPIFHPDYWTRYTSLSPEPSARLQAPMEYDPVRDECVLFGGDVSGSYNAETWVYKNAVWSQKAPARSPAGRYGGKLSWDSYNERILMFGGQDAIITLPTCGRNDVEAWDGTTWANVQPDGAGGQAAQPRIRHAQCYDSTYRRLIIACGWTGSANIKTASSLLVESDTWGWINDAPHAMMNCSMAHNPVDKYCYMIGGYVFPSGPTYRYTERFDTLTNTWTTLSFAGGDDYGGWLSQVVIQAEMFWHPDLEQICIMCSGNWGGKDVLQLWGLDPSIPKWSLLHNDEQIDTVWSIPSYDFGSAYDEEADTMVAFFKPTGSSYSEETWAFEETVCHEFYNLGFESPDVGPGQALYWDEAYDDGDEDCGQFWGGARFFPMDGFEGGWGDNENSQTSFADSDLAAAPFEEDNLEYEPFGYSWAAPLAGPPFNHQGVNVFLPQNFALGSFDSFSEDYEDFEEKWDDNETSVADLDAATTSAGDFDSGTPEAVEDFEEEWLDNEGSVDDFDDGTKSFGNFDSTPEGYEDFEEEWTTTLP